MIADEALATPRRRGEAPGRELIERDTRGSAKDEGSSAASDADLGGVPAYQLIDAMIDGAEEPAPAVLCAMPDSCVQTEGHLLVTCGQGW